MRTWFTIILLASLALSGCAGTEPETAEANAVEAPADTTDDTPETVEETTNSTEETATNTTETIALALDASVDNTTVIAGSPVTVTIDGSGDDLSWAVLVDGTEVANGTEVPTTYAHTFDMAGEYLLSVDLSDGVETQNASFTITVEEFDPSHPDAFSAVFEMIEGCELCIDSELIPTVGQLGAAGCVGWNLEENEVDCAWAAIPEGFAGYPWSAYSFTSGTIPETGTDGDVDIEFFTACNPDAESLGIVREASFGQHETGIIPEGAGCMVAFEFSWPNLGHTIELSIGADIHSS